MPGNLSYYEEILKIAKIKVSTQLTTVN